MLEIDFRAVKFLFFPRRDLKTHTIDTLQHHSLSLTSSALDHSTTSIYIYLFTSKIVCKTTPNTQNKVFNYFSLCFVYLVLFYKPFKTFIIYFTCIVSLYRNDPTPRKIDRWLVVQTMYIYVFIYNYVFICLNFLVVSCKPSYVLNICLVIWYVFVFMM